MNDVKSLHKTIVQLKYIVKYGIFLMSVLCTTHCGLLCLGYDLFIVHMLYCAFALLLGIYLSKTFSLCWAHKLCVLYIVLILTCVVFKRHDKFSACGIDIEIARILMFLFGVVVSLMALWKTRRI